MGGVLDAIESWVAGQGYWVQVVVLLGVLLPLGFWVAGVIDRLVDRLVGHPGHAGHRGRGVHGGPVPAGSATPVRTAGSVAGTGPDEGPSR